MKPKVYLRTDGSAAIGLGHLVRCIALGHMLKKAFDVCYVCKEIPDKIADEIKGHSFGLLKINDEIFFFQQLRTEDLVVLDGYDFSTGYQEKVKAIGCKLICIDDIPDKKFVSHLIINHSPFANPQDYSTCANTWFALGLEYILLRPSFLKAMKMERKIKQIKTVLICFGGSDQKNHTLAALKVVSEVQQLDKIYVVTGPAYTYYSTLETFIELDKRVEYRSSIGEREMCDIMLQSDLAIVPASGTLYEVMATGGLIVTGLTADNQKLIYESFINKDYVFDAGNFAVDEIKRAIQQALRQTDNDIKQVRKEYAISDEKIVKLFSQLRESRNLKLRIVAPEDIDITFQWAVDPMIRSHSFSQEKITFEEHKRWFAHKLITSNCIFFIAEYADKIIGSIRFDLENHTARISYLLDSEFHGKGLGTALLSNGIEKLLTEDYFPGISQFEGAVFKTNFPSIKAFTRLGFISNNLGDHLISNKTITECEHF